MAYTEIKEKNGMRYYYRAQSIRNEKKFKKERIYLGKNLTQMELNLKEKEADKKLVTKKKSKILNKIIPKIRKILKQNKIKRAGIFGSYARGKPKKDSDIDILVELPQGVGFGFVKIETELEKKLGKKVDLVSYKGISPYLKDRILSQEIRII